MSAKKYVVLTDSACDLPPGLAEKYEIEILNFEISVDGTRYVEREDFTFDEYYDILRKCEGVPSTALITMARFLERFQQHDDSGVEELLYVSINATGSATNDAAKMAEKEFRAERPNSKMKIHIIDSRTYSMGYGHQVAEAARKLKNGAQMSEIVEWLEDIFSKTEVILAAFSLKFIKKSGRISAAAAFAGELLGLRPIISLTDGKSIVEKKVRGDKDVLPALMDYVESRMDETQQYSVGGTNQAIMDELAALCTKKWKTKPFSVFKLGAAVSTNTGPDAIAIIFIGEKRQ